MADKGPNPFDVLENRTVEIVNELLDRRKLDASKIRGTIGGTTSFPHTIIGSQHTDSAVDDSPSEGDVLTYSGGEWTASPATGGSADFAKIVTAPDHLVDGKVHWEIVFTADGEIVTTAL